MPTGLRRSLWLGIIAVALSLAGFSSRAALAQELDWAKRAGGGSLESASSIAVDATGNSYVTGRFFGSSTFGPGEANETVLTTAGSEDVFVAKYDGTGMLVWATRAGGSGLASGVGIAVDEAGNSYVSGVFFATATFGPGEANETVLTSVGNRDIFVAKYDAAGALVWATRAGGPSFDNVGRIAVDGAGNTYVTGWFNETATFGAGEANQTSLMAGVGDSGFFAAKYGANGTLVWARKADSALGFAIAVDADGNSYATGMFRQTATFGPGEANETVLTSPATQNLFVVKYDAAGALVWARAAQAGGSLGHPFVIGLGIAVDAAGNSYTTGYFLSALATFGPGEANETLLTANSQDIFLAKYDAAGALVWAKQAGGTGWDVGHGIAVDEAGNSYVTGEFSGTATFGAGQPNETLLTSPNSTDIFLAKYDAAGALVWATRAGGTGWNIGQGVAVDGAGNSYVTGLFDGTAFFGPGEVNETVLVGAGDLDIFVAKYSGSKVDLTLNKSASPSRVVRGSLLTYTLAVSNGGAADASGVVVTDALPPDVTFVSVSPVPECTETGGVITCMLGVLASGDSRSITIQVTPDVDGVITNTAIVVANEDEGDAADNEASVSTTVVPPNQDPIAQDDSVTTGESVAVTIDVLANDTDPDGGELTVISAQGMTGGSVLIKADGTLTYAPDPGFTGVDSFTYTIDDGRGGTATATVTVTVADTTAPVLTVPADAVVEATGPSGAVHVFAATAVDLVDPNPVVSCTLPPGSTFPLGATTVNCSATDFSGNVANGRFDVTVVDSTPPVLTVLIDFAVEATGLQTAVAVGAATATDTVDPAPVVSHDAPATFPLGTTVVTWTATDASGNSSSATQRVTLVDTTPPVLTVPADAVVEATGPGGAVHVFAASADDLVDPNPVVSCVPSSDSSFPLGTTMVNCSVTDFSGNVADGSFNVMIVDTTPPLLSVPANLTVEGDTLGGASASNAAVLAFLAGATANDAVDGPVPATPPAPPALFLLGATVVRFSATDAAGNTATAAATVTVVDTTPPALTVPTDMTVEAQGGFGAVVTVMTATATDLVDPAPAVVCAPSAGSIFPLGGTTVKCTATDASGNVGVGSFTVTVADTTPPEIHSVAANPDVLWPANQQMVPVDVTVVATDNVDPAPMCQVTGVASNEPPSGAGSDAIVTDHLALELRAERSGSGSGRVYTIGIACADASGNVSVAQVPVLVPHDARSGVTTGPRGGRNR